MQQPPPPFTRTRPIPLGWLSLATGMLTLLLAGCSPIEAERFHPPRADLPLPMGIRVAFNHRSDQRYRSPINGLREVLLSDVQSS